MNAAEELVLIRSLMRERRLLLLVSKIKKTIIR